MADTLDLSCAKEWAQVCGSCDYGLVMTCTCRQGDPRGVILDLIREVERLRQLVGHRD